MIVHRSPIYRRSAMPTIGPHPLNGQIWTCSAKYSCFIISHSQFVTSSMQHPALAQQAFSSECVLTVFHVFPTIEFLLTSLEAAEKHVTCALICNAIMAGISNLTKWYRKLDACHVYAVSNGKSNQTALGHNQLIDLTVLDPSIKLAYIKKNWGPDFILHTWTILETIVSTYIFD